MTKQTSQGDDVVRWNERCTGRLAHRIVWVAAFAISFVVQSPGGTYETQWDPSWHASGLSQFYYVAYPRRDDVATHTKKDGPATGVLRRAVLAEHDAMKPGESVFVRDSGPGMWVRAEDLQLLPPTRAGTDYLAGLKDSLRSQSEPSSIRVVNKTRSDGTTAVSAEWWIDGDYELFEYTVAGETVTPLARRTLNGKERAFSFFSKLGVSVLIAWVAVAILMVRNLTLDIRKNRRNRE